MKGKKMKNQAYCMFIFHPEDDVAHLEEDLVHLDEEAIQLAEDLVPMDDSLISFDKKVDDDFADDFDGDLDDEIDNELESVNEPIASGGGHILLDDSFIHPGKSIVWLRYSQEDVMIFKKGGQLWN
jgi:hypothetical protein